MRTTWEAYFKLFCVYSLGAMTISKTAFAVPPLSITGHSIITLQNSAQHNNTLRIDNDTYYDTILSQYYSHLKWTQNYNQYKCCPNYGTQPDNIQQNDTQHNETMHNDTQHNYTMHNYTQHNYTQHNFIQQN